MPTIDGIDLNEFVQKLAIEVIRLPITYLPPAEHGKLWRNQFYIFDVLGYVSNELKDAVHLVLDSDCIISQIVKWGLI